MNIRDHFYENISCNNINYIKILLSGFLCQFAFYKVIFIMIFTFSSHMRRYFSKYGYRTERLYGIYVSNWVLITLSFEST